MKHGEICFLKEHGWKQRKESVLMNLIHLLHVRCLILGLCVVNITLRPQPEQWRGKQKSFCSHSTILSLLQTWLGSSFSVWKEKEKLEGREVCRSHWAFVFKNTHHLPSGLHWTKKPEYHPSYATELNQLRILCRRITRNIRGSSSRESLVAFF